MGNASTTLALLAYNTSPPLSTSKSPSPPPQFLNTLITTLRRLSFVPLPLLGHHDLSHLLSSLESRVLSHFQHLYNYEFTLKSPRPVRMPKRSHALPLSELISCPVSSPQSIAAYILTLGLTTTVPRAYQRSVAADLTASIRACLATPERGGVWRLGGFKRVYEDEVGFIGNYAVEVAWIWCVVDCVYNGRKGPVLFMWYAGCGYESKEMPPPMMAPKMVVPKIVGVKGKNEEEGKRRGITF